MEGRRTAITTHQAASYTTHQAQIDVVIFRCIFPITLLMGRGGGGGRVVMVVGVS